MKFWMIGSESNLLLSAFKNCREFKHPQRIVQLTLTFVFYKLLRREITNLSLQGKKIILNTLLIITSMKFLCNKHFFFFHSHAQTNDQRKKQFYWTRKRERERGTTPLYRYFFSVPKMTLPRVLETSISGRKKIIEVWHGMRP